MTAHSGAESVTDSRTTRGGRDPSLLAIVAESRGVRSLVKLPRESGAQLEAMKDIIGGFLEAVTIDAVPTIIMWCNEDGYSLDLRPNAFATMLAGGRSLILGNVIFTGGPDANGDITSIDSHWIETLI